MASQDWFEGLLRDPRRPRDADEPRSRRRTARLARKHHPDQNAGDAAAEQRFKDIGEANAVLSDPKQRQEYDAVRSMVNGGARPSAPVPMTRAG